MATLPRKQLEAPSYNHPCGDLLDSGRRETYINICIPLYIASIKGDLEAARVILDGHGYLVRYSITEKKESPLHVVAGVHNSEFVKYLVDILSEDDLKLQNEEGNNAFCLAVISGNRKMAMIMLQKNRELLTIRGSGNMMPLYLAAWHYTQRDMITYLYDHSQCMASDGWTDDDRNTVFLECIKIGCLDVALRMLNDREELPQDKYVWNVLHELAQSTYVFDPEPFLKIKPPYWERRYYERNPIYHLHTGILKIRKESEAAKHLLRNIWKKIVVKNKDEIDEILRGPVVKIGEKDTYPSQILFAAAQIGNANFLVELIREYPDLIWKTNDDGQTIFHIGLSYHHPSIFNLFCSIGALKDTISKVKDKDGNTLVHSVSKNTGRNPYEHVRGASSQLVFQLDWYKRVRAMVPRFSEEQLMNVAGQTPLGLFEHTHKDLTFKAEKWIEETSNQCLVVATLITTISFAAAFTIPGGYNQDTGFPMFIQNTPFTVFVIFDSISFILSTASILIFLPIIFSTEQVFNHTKFSIGFLALLFSIITLMAAFSASFFVLYHNKLPIIMTSLATVPIIVFFLLECKSLIKMDVLAMSPELTSWSKKPMLYSKILKVLNVVIVITFKISFHFKLFFDQGHLLKV